MQMIAKKVTYSYDCRAVGTGWASGAFDHPFKDLGRNSNLKQIFLPQKVFDYQLFFPSNFQIFLRAWAEWRFCQFAQTRQKLTKGHESGNYFPVIAIAAV